MKKSLMFVAVAAAGMLASCSSDSLIAGSDPTIEPTPTQEERVPIEIGVASVQTKATTRGTGPVGGISVEDNKWKSQEVNVFMFNKNSLEKALDDPDDENSAIYYNTVMTTPNNENSGYAIEYLDGAKTNIKHRYYPQRGNFDFWGYYIDDASSASAAVLYADVDEYNAAKDPDITAEQFAALPDEDKIKTPAVPAIVIKASEIVGGDQDLIAPFSINGTQDLMVAKAVPTAAEITALGTRGDDFYSAYAARKLVQPNLTFKHLLTQLTFQIKGGTPSSCGWSWKETATPGTYKWFGPTTGQKFTGVFVNSIKIKSKTTGYIVAAYTRENMSTDDRYTDATKLIKFADADDNDLTLQGKDGGRFYSWLPAAVDEAYLTVTEAGNDAYAELYKATAEPTDASAENTAWTYTPIDLKGAMLLQTRDSYVMEIELGQYLLDLEDEADAANNTYKIKSSKISDIPVVVDPADPSKKFEIGKAYTLTITVYGNEEIKIKTTLEGWIDGGNVPVSYD